MQTFNPKVLAVLGLVGTNLFWASNAVVARYAAVDIPPVSLAFARWLLAFILLLPFAWPHIRNNIDHIKQHYPVIIVLGVLGISIFNTCLYLGAHATTAVNITMVSSSLPLLTLLISFIMLNTVPSRWQIVGIAVSLLGVCVIIAGGDLKILQQMQFNQGDIIILLISLMWSVYTVILRKYPLDLHPIALLTTLIGAGLPLLVVMALFEAVLLPSVSPLYVYTDHAALLAYIVLFPSVSAYILWNYGVKVLGPTISALSCYLMPLFTVLLAVPLLGEALYRFHVVGGLMILIGFYLASFVKSDNST